MQCIYVKNGQKLRHKQDVWEHHKKGRILQLIEMASKGNLKIKNNERR
jgi:hypothetical protein